MPFPDLKWDSPDNTEANLAELREFATQLAYSALDWYLEKKRGKKNWAQWLHLFTYAFGILAALVPLAMIVFPGLVSFKGYFSDPAAFAAEVAVVLAGIAGGFTLVDRSVGFTADWMRYIGTATNLNRELIAFQLDWDELAYAAAKNRDKPDPGPTGKAAARRAKKNDPDAQRINRVKVFCLKILEITGEETGIWANELKERLAQMARNWRQANQP